ncbi:MAG TPA: YceI family protein [Pirellulales bacterium]|nr:YceI family protein [Pirellulales bacterium]
MSIRSSCLICFALVALAFPIVETAAAAAADKFDLDAVHSSISFKTRHMGLTWIHGRFNSFSGHFVLDREKPAKSSFELTIPVESIDTNNKGRDMHLQGPDFFNVKQFPSITFKSTKVKAVEGGFEVTGDMTMHGVTKPVTLTLEGGETAEFPPGTQRVGFSTSVTLKRSDFGMDKMLEAIGDETPIEIGIEGVKK